MNGVKRWSHSQLNINFTPATFTLPRFLLVWPLISLHLVLLLQIFARLRFLLINSFRSNKGFIRQLDVRLQDLSSLLRASLCQTPGTEHRLPLGGTSGHEKESALLSFPPRLRALRRASGFSFALVNYTKLECEEAVDICVDFCHWASSPLEAPCLTAASLDLITSLDPHLSPLPLTRHATKCQRSGERPAGGRARGEIRVENDVNATFFLNALSIIREHEANVKKVYFSAKKKDETMIWDAENNTARHNYAKCQWIINLNFQVNSPCCYFFILFFPLKLFLSGSSNEHQHQ